MMYQGSLTSSSLFRCSSLSYPLPLAAAAGSDVVFYVNSTAVSSAQVSVRHRSHSRLAGLREGIT